MKETKNTVEFEGRVEKCIYNKSDSDWAIYAMNVDPERYPNIKQNRYENVSICGEIADLSLSRPYVITAVEQDSKYGPTYKVQKMHIIKPKTGEEVYTFLREVLTENQAAELYREYPNIIELVEQERDNEVDTSRLKGIGEKTLWKIIDKINTNIILFDLVTEFGGILSLKILKKLYDEYCSVEAIRRNLRKEPYKCLTRISGIGFIKADAMLLQLEKEKRIDFGYDLKTSPQRCSACMEYYLLENQNEGNTKMDLRDLRKMVMQYVPACAHHYVDCLKKDDFYYDKETFDVALRETYNTEKYIAEKIANANNNPRIWNINWKSYQSKGEYPLTDEQLSALRCICNNNIMILNGFGGSGKSATSGMIIKMLEDNNIQYKLFAPTGRAAKVLSDYTERPAATIHRGLGYMPPNWCYNEDAKLITDVVLVDEFSMTDIFLFKHLVEAIDFERTKLILVGDSAQLPSVGPGNLLHDFIRSKKIPTVTLNKIFRYGEGGLMAVATDIRNMEEYLSKEAFQVFGNNQDYTFVNVASDKMILNVVSLYAKLLKVYKPEDILVLSAYNKGDYGTVAINNHLQKLANKENYGSENCIEIKDIKYYVNDIIIQTTNNYHAAIYFEGMDLGELENGKDIFNYKEDGFEETFIPNGMIGKITSIIDKKYVIINFDGIEVVYMKDNMRDVSLGYCISIHKSQGGSAKIVMLISPSAHTFMMNSNLLYVGITRTKEKCYHLGNIETVNRAVKQKENFNRKTFMLGMLLNK